jgi:transglutaminase-like putative cysteine protease
MKNKQLSSKHLHWLLLSLGAVLAIHSINLPLWITVITAGLGIWRYLLDTKHWALPKMRVLIPITILISLGLLINYSSGFGRDASVSLLVTMCAMKLLETKTRRDYILIISIAYFLVASTYIFSQTVSTFLLSLIPLILLTATLIQTSTPQAINSLFTLKLAGKMLLQSMPLMLALFVLFPRLPGPVWGISKDAYSGMTGLNDVLELGDVGNLIRNSSVAFRVKFKDDIPSSNQLYWRGPVLWTQQGNKWLTTSENNRLGYESLATTSSSIDYTITLEPHNRLWLLMLDMPTSLPNIATLKHDYSAIAKKPVRTRIRYQVTSHPQYKLSQNINPQQRKMALAINNTNAQSIALAQSWSHLPPETIIATALKKFNEEPFVYTLRPPRLSENAIDAFLFKTKKGFCEHYASSFVFLMRAAGVPARIVTGYQGGEINPNGNYLIVRQSDAHAWAEVWLENKGWVRVDPTGAVAPERIEQGIEQALDEMDELPIFVRQSTSWLKKAYLNWDNINNNWNQWVLGYDNQKQLDFLSKLSGKDLSITDIAISMIVAILMAMIITAATVLTRKKLKPSLIEQYYANHLKQLKKWDIQQNLGEGALDFAHRVGKSRPNQAQQIIKIAELYNELRYSAHQNSVSPNQDSKLQLFKQLISILHDNKND